MATDPDKLFPIFVRSMYPDQRSDDLACPIRRELLQLFATAGVPLKHGQIDEMPYRRELRGNNTPYIEFVRKTLKQRPDALPIVVAFTVGNPEDHLFGFFRTFDLLYPHPYKRMGIVLAPEWSSFTALYSHSTSTEDFWMRRGELFCLRLLDESTERYEPFVSSVLARFLDLPAPRLLSGEQRVASADDTLEVPAQRRSQPVDPRAEPDDEDDRPTLRPVTRHQ